MPHPFEKAQLPSMPVTCDNEEPLLLTFSAITFYLKWKESVKKFEASLTVPSPVYGMLYTWEDEGRAQVPEDVDAIHKELKIGGRVEKVTFQEQVQY